MNGVMKGNELELVTWSLSSFYFHFRPMDLYKQVFAPCDIFLIPRNRHGDSTTGEGLSPTEIVPSR